MQQKLIQDLVDNTAFEQIKKLKVDLKELRSEFEASIKLVKSLNDNLKNPSNSYGALQIIKQLDQANKNLSTSTNKLTSDLKEQNKLIGEKNRLAIQEEQLARAQHRTNEAKAKSELASTKAVTAEKRLSTAETKEAERAERSNSAAVASANRERERQKKLLHDATNEYRQLTSALDAAVIKYRNLYITQGQYAAVTKAALKDVIDMRNFLARLDNTMIGNTKTLGGQTTAMRMLGVNTQQVFREMPAMAVSANTFFLAISNNLPMLFDSMKAVKLEIAEATKAAKAGALVAKEKATADALAAGQTRAAAKAAGDMAYQQHMQNANIGKAPSLWKAMGSAIFSWQTLLAVGITLLTLYGGKLFEWIRLQTQGVSVTRLAREEMKALNKSYESSYTEAGKQIGQLTKLNAVLKSTTTNALAKKGAYDQFIKMYPSYAAQIKDEYQRTGQLTGMVALLTRQIIAAAKARAMQSRIDELAAKNELLYDKRVQAMRNKMDADQTMAKYESQRLSSYSSGGTMAGSGGTPTGASWLYDQAVRRRDKATKEWDNLFKEMDFNSRKMDDYAERILVKTEQTGNLTMDGIDPAKFIKKEKAEREEKDKSNRAEIKAEEDLYKARMTYAIKTQEMLFTVLGDPKYREAQLALEKEMIDGLVDIRLKRTKMSAAEILKIREESAAEIKTVEIQAENDKKLKQIETEQFIIDSLDRIYEHEVEQSKLRRQLRENNAEDVLNGFLYGNSTRQKQDERALNDSYARGKVTREQYEQALIDIQYKYSKIGLQETINQTFALLQIADLEESEREKLGQRLLDAQKKLNNLELDEEQRKVMKKVEYNKWMKDKLIELGKEVVGLAFDLGGRQFQILEQVLEKQSDRIESNRDKEIDAIEKTTLSEQDKADKISLINAKADAEQRSIEKRQQEAAVKKAKFDRAKAIADVVTATAVAVMQVIGVPFYGQAMAAVIAAIGAVQLARVAAQSIPEYAKGRKGGKAELALVGEAGSERIEHVDGKSYMVHKPTVTFLPQGASVISNKQLLEEGKVFEKNRILSENNHSYSTGNSEKNVIFTTEKIVDALHEQTQAIKQNKVNVHVNRTWKGDSVSVQRMNSYQTWINNNI